MKRVTQQELSCKQLYTLLHPDLTHHQFTWQIGLNTDPRPIDPKNSVRAHEGLYFGVLPDMLLVLDISKKINLDDYLLGRVSVPKDETEIYTDGEGGYKSRSAMLLDLTRLDQLPEDQYELVVLYILRNRWYVKLQQIKRRTTAIIMAGLLRDPNSIQHVTHPQQTSEMAELALVHSPQRNKIHIRPDLLTTKLYEHVVSYRHEALQWVPKELQSAKMCRLALWKQGRLLQWVRADLQTPELLACASNDDQFRWLQYISRSLQTKRLCKRYLLHDMTQLEYVRRDLQTPKLRAQVVQRFIRRANLRFPNYWSSGVYVNETPDVGAMQRKLADSTSIESSILAMLRNVDEYKKIKDLKTRRWLLYCYWCMYTDLQGVKNNPIYQEQRKQDEFEDDDSSSSEEE